MSAIHDEAFAEFEALGEAEVRKRSMCGDLHTMKQEPARVWLALKAASSITAIRRDVRIDRYIAVTAVIIAAIAAHKEIRWLISSVISLFSN